MEELVRCVMWTLEDYEQPEGLGAALQASEVQAVLAENGLVSVLVLPCARACGSRECAAAADAYCMDSLS